MLKKILIVIKYRNKNKNILTDSLIDWAHLKEILSRYKLSEYIYNIISCESHGKNDVIKYNVLETYLLYGMYLDMWKLHVVLIVYASNIFF
jgi:hypothetical protein